MKGRAKKENPYKVVSMALAVSLLLVLGGLVHYRDKYKGLEETVVESKLAQEKLLSEKLAAEKVVYIQQKELEELEEQKKGIEQQLKERNAQLTALSKRMGKKVVQVKTKELQGQETNRIGENTSDTQFVIYQSQERSGDKKEVKKN